MGHEELLKVLDKEALREKENIIEEARLQADAIINRAIEEALRLKNKRLEDAKEELKKKKESSLNLFRLEMAGRLLKLKSDAADRVLKEAMDKVKTLAQKDYDEIINRFYKELKDDWRRNGNGKAPLVYVNPKDRKLIKDPDAEVLPDEGVSLGVVFVSMDGRIRHENTFGSRLSRLRKVVMTELKRTLFD